jgi:hypothetical protein
MMRRLSITIKSSGGLTYRRSLRPRFERLSTRSETDAWNDRAVANLETHMGRNCPARQVNRRRRPDAEFETALSRERPVL